MITRTGYLLLICSRRHVGASIILYNSSDIINIGTDIVGDILASINFELEGDKVLAICCCWRWVGPSILDTDFKYGLCLVQVFGEAWSYILTQYSCNYGIRAGAHQTWGVQLKVGINWVRGGRCILVLNHKVDCWVLDRVFTDVLGLSV